MASQNLKAPMRELQHDAKAYIDMRISALKLQAVEYLSIVCNTLLFHIVLILLAHLALIALMVAFTIWIDQLIGSLVAGLCITAGICLLLMIPVFIFRKKLFMTNFVRLFSNLFFSAEEERKMPVNDECEK